MASAQAQDLRPGGGRLNLLPLALLAVLLGFALFGDRGILHMMKLSGQKEVLSQAVAEVESQNEALRVEINSLRSDRRYIEQVARTELGMVRDDELVFQFSDK